MTKKSMRILILILNVENEDQIFYIANGKRESYIGILYNMMLSVPETNNDIHTLMH